MADNISSMNQENNVKNAVSIFGQNGASADEFPVLKAFQQYIDAEQAKARKRMLGLSIFFVVLLVVVVVTFVMVLTAVINRNQSLSDRLLEMAFRQQSQVVQPVAAPAPVVVNSAQPQPRANEELKPLADQIAALASAIKDQQKNESRPVAQERADFAQTALEQKLKERDEVIKLEQQRLAEVEKKLKAMEIERQQRRNYPEYFRKKDAEEQLLKTIEMPSPTKSPNQPIPSAPKGTVNQTLKIDSRNNGPISWYVAMPE